MMIPAIDLIDGQVVRLYQGDYEQKTNYVYTAKERQDLYASAGATVMHFVDLDGAKDSTKRQLELLKTLVNHDTMTIQVGGGVRCKEDVEQLLNVGADRVVIGSLAIKQPEMVAEWIKEFGGEKIVLALDIKIDAQGNKTLPTHGWIEDSGVNLEELLAQYQDAGIKHVLCTDISKDGMLEGPAFELYQSLLEQVKVKLIASGGISKFEELPQLQELGCEGVIIGKAIYENRISLKALEHFIINSN